jgi:hypothetical protein
MKRSGLQENEVSTHGYIQALVQKLVDGRHREDLGRLFLGAKNKSNRVNAGSYIILCLIIVRGCMVEQERVILYETLVL